MQLRAPGNLSLGPGPRIAGPLLYKPSLNWTRVRGLLSFHFPQVMAKERDLYGKGRDEPAILRRNRKRKKEQKKLMWHISECGSKIVQAETLHLDPLA